MDIAPILSDWIDLPAPAAGAAAPVTESAAGPDLCCWWARPAEGPIRGGVLVLPEVFGLNGWVRSVADRLAGQGYAALAVPLFARTAPGLELDYDDEGLRQGRAHKDLTTTTTLLADLERAASWLQAQLPAAGGRPAGLGCVGFCFGGHVALLAASLPQVIATCDFYGAGVASGRPGGGPPSLELLPAIEGSLLCFCGLEDPLIPPADVASIRTALEAANAHRSTAVQHPGRPPHRLLELQAGHGFMCEQRADHRSEAAATGWREMLAFFGTTLGA
jgi:carboxymethylenebutenolidase